MNGASAKLALRSSLADSTQPSRPFRIGIWCDYEYVTILEQGIGIFVQNLVRGLLELDEPLEVVLLVRPGDQRLPTVQALRERSPSRLHVAPPESSRRVDDVLASLMSLARRALLIATHVSRVAGSTLGIAKNVVQRVVDAALTRSAGPASPVLRAAAITALLVIGPVVAVAFPAWRLLRAIARTIVFPLHALEYILQMALDRPRDFVDDAATRAAAARCDAWLIPYDGLEVPLDFPAVLVIHDLVHLHFRDTFPREVLARLEEIIPARAAEATRCACMSQFIRRHDLEGMLHLPASKVRVIRPAAPEDFPEVSAAQLRRLKPQQLTRPYALFPAAFRPYKNHRLLIDLLHVLADEGEDWLDLVFTGFVDDLPPELAERIARRRLAGRVHVLGFVGRPTLAALYRRAFVTLVPSLYEQGSFPIYEALAWQCPVACSSIPALREQCESMGSAMLYFDPHDPRDVARVVLEIRDRRAEILAAQQAAKSILWQRSWKEAAGEWLDLLREAAAAHEVPTLCKTTSVSRRAA